MKRIFFALPIFFALALVVLAPSAHAASDSGNTLPASDAVILKQALDILQKVLNQLSARLAVGDQVVLADSKEINASLAGIRGKLFSIDGTLAAFGKNNPAFAMVRHGSPQVAPAQKDNSFAYVNPENVHQANPGSADAGVSAPAQEAVPAATTPSGNTGIAAVVGNFASNKKVVWPSVAVLVVLAVIWRLRAIRKENESVLAVADNLPQPAPTPIFSDPY